MKRFEDYTSGKMLCSQRYGRDMPLSKAMEDQSQKSFGLATARMLNDLALAAEQLDKVDTGILKTIGKLLGIVEVEIEKRKEQQKQIDFIMDHTGGRTPMTGSLKELYDDLKKQ